MSDNIKEHKISKPYFATTGGDTSFNFGLIGIISFILGITLIFFSLIGIFFILLGIYFFLINQYAEIDFDDRKIRTMNFLPPFKSGNWKDINDSDYLILTYKKEKAPEFFVGAFYRKRKIQNAWFDIYLRKKNNEDEILIFTSDNYGQSLKKLQSLRKSLEIEFRDLIKENRTVRKARH